MGLFWLTALDGDFENSRIETVFLDESDKDWSFAVLGPDVRAFIAGSAGDGGSESKSRSSDAATVTTPDQASLSWGKVVPTCSAEQVGTDASSPRRAV
jgi:hypothetical protein